MTKDNLLKWGTRLYTLGYIGIILSTIYYITQEDTSKFYISATIFGITTVITIIGRYITLPQPDDFKTKRLNRILAISAILLCVTCYFMFKHNNAWAISLTIAAFIDIYTSFRYKK